MDFDHPLHYPPPIGGPGEELMRWPEPVGPEKEEGAIIAAFLYTAALLALTANTVLTLCCSWKVSPICQRLIN